METLPETNTNYNNQTRVFLEQIREKHKKDDLEKTCETVNNGTAGQKIKRSPGKKTREIKYNQKIFYVKLYFWLF